jgi:hypothetical protein
MNIDEAFKTLSLPIEASEEEIKEAHRALSKIHHPDVQTGDNDTQANLNAAYEMACAYAKVRNAVLPIKPSEFLEQIYKAIAAQVPSTNANELARIVEKSNTTTLQRIKMFAWGIGGMNAAIAIAGKDFLRLFLTEQVATEVQPLLTVIAFICGGVALFFQLLVTRIQNRIDFFLEDISDKRKCATKLAEALHFQDVEIVQEGDLFKKADLPSSKREPSDPFEPFHKVRGYVIPDLDRKLKTVLLTKSKEHGLIELIPQEEIRPDYIETYRLRFQPSLFKKKEESIERVPEQPSQPLKPSELIPFWIATILLGSLTAYLYLSIGSNWSILSGIFAGFFFLGATGMTLETILSKRKKNSSP